MIRCCDRPVAASGGGLADIYDSYTTDPKYARIFTVCWTGVVAALALANVPRLVRTKCSNRLWQSGWYLSESPVTAEYSLLAKTGDKRQIKSKAPSSSYAHNRLFQLYQQFSRPLGVPFKSSIYPQLSLLQLLAVVAIPALALGTILPEQCVIMALRVVGLTQTHLQAIALQCQ